MNDKEKLGEILINISLKAAELMNFVDSIEGIDTKILGTILASSKVLAAVNNHLMYKIIEELIEKDKTNE